MITLLISAVMTSAADSINPIAITQQFVLQGMVKKDYHIWYFIIAIGATNFLSGILAYYGLLTPIIELVKNFLSEYQVFIQLVEIILVVVCFILCGYFIGRMKAQKEDASTVESKQVNIRFKNITPLTLSIIGVGATLSELTSALPYFVFLGILTQYKLSFLSVILILVLYNIIYSLPLILFYWLYKKAMSKFEQCYKFMQRSMNKISKIILPLLTFLVGSAVLYHLIIV